MATRIPNTQHHPDGTLSWTPEGGKPIFYREEPSGTFYHAKTSRKVVDELEAARLLGKPVRIFYGDPLTGKDWLEEKDVEGKLGRSMGPLKVPGLVTRARFDLIIDHCVVRLHVAGREVYRRPLYHQPALAEGPSGSDSKPYGVFDDGKIHAAFKTDLARGPFIVFNFLGASFSLLSLV